MNSQAVSKKGRKSEVSSRPVTQALGSSIQTDKTRDVIPNKDLAHAIAVSPSNMTNPVGSSHVVTPVLAPTLELSQNVLERESGPAASKFKEGVGDPSGRPDTHCLETPSKMTGERLMMSVHESNGPLENSLSMAIQTKKPKPMVMTQKDFNKQASGTFTIGSPRQTLKVNSIMIDGAEKQFDVDVQTQNLHSNRKFRESNLGSTLPFRSEMVHLSLQEAKSSTGIKLGPTAKDLGNKYKKYQNSQGSHSGNYNNHLVAKSPMLSKDSSNREGILAINRHITSRGSKGSTKQQLSKLKSSTNHDVGFTFHSIDSGQNRTNSQVNGSSTPDLMLALGSQVNSTVLCANPHELISLEHTPDAVEEAVTQTNSQPHQRQQSFPQNAPSQVQDEIEVDYPIEIGKSPSFLNTQKYHQQMHESSQDSEIRKSKEDEATGKFAVCPSVNIQIRESANEQQRSQSTSLEQEVLLPSHYQSLDAIQQQPSSNAISPMKACLSTGSQARFFSLSPSQAQPSVMINVGTTADAATSPDVVEQTHQNAGGYITVTMAKSPQSRHPNVQVSGHVSNGEASRPISHLTFLVSKQKVASKMFPSKLTSARYQKQSLQGPNQILAKMTPQELIKRSQFESKKATTVTSTQKQSVDSAVDTEAERIEKIRGNLKLIDQIMSMGESTHNNRSRSNDVYLPLPNHNYVHSGKNGVWAAPAKAQYYQIKKPSSKFFIKEPKMAGKILRQSLESLGHPNQSVEQLQKRLSINVQSVGDIMQQEFIKLTNAQEKLFRQTARHYRSVASGTMSDSNMSPREVVMLDQDGNQIASNTHSVSRSIESDDRVHLRPATEAVGTNTTGSQVANFSNTMKQKSSMITTITGSKAPTTIMASKINSAHLVSENDNKSKSQPKQVAALSQTKFNNETKLACTVRSPSQYVVKVDTTSDAPSKSQSISTSKRQPSKLYSFGHHAAATLELNWTSSMQETTPEAWQKDISAKELTSDEKLKFNDKDTKLGGKHSKGKLVLSVTAGKQNLEMIANESFGRENGEELSRQGSVSAQNMPETANLTAEKQGSYSNKKTTNQSQEDITHTVKTEKSEQQQIQLDQVHSSSSTTPQIKLERPVFRNNVEDLKLYQQKTSNSALYMNENNSNIFDGSARFKPQNQRQIKLKVQHLSKKKDNSSIDKLNTDLKRDLTKAMDYAGSEKKKNIVNKETRFGIPKAHQAQTIEKMQTNGNLDTNKSLMDEYRGFNLEEDFTVHTAGKRMEESTDQTRIGQYISPAHLFNQQPQKSIANFTNAVSDENPGQQYRSFSIQQKQLVNTVNSDGGKSDVYSVYAKGKPPNQMSFNVQKSTLKLDDSTVGQNYTATQSKVDTVCNTQTRSSMNMVRQNNPSAGDTSNAANKKRTQPLLSKKLLQAQTKKDSSIRQQSESSQQECDSRANRLAESNDAIQVKDFAKLAQAQLSQQTSQNRQLQQSFGMSIDVRVSREGTMPVSIPGESELTSAGAVPSQTRNKQGEFVNTHLIDGKDITPTMTPLQTVSIDSNNRQFEVTSGTNNAYQTTTLDSKPNLKSDGCEHKRSIKTASQLQRPNRKFSYSKQKSKSGGVFSKISTEDDYMMSKMVNKEGQKVLFGPIEGCLDVRSSLLSPKQRTQLFSSSKNPATTTQKINANTQVVTSPLQHLAVSNKQQKQFVIQFNDFVRKNNNLGQGMEIVGQNYKNGDYLSAKQHQNRLLSAPSNDQHFKTLETLNQQRHHVNASSTQDSLDYLYSNEQIQMSSMAKSGHLGAVNGLSTQSDYFTTEAVNHNKRYSQRVNLKNGDAQTQDKLKTVNARKNIMMHRNKILKRQKMTYGALVHPRALSGEREKIDTNFVLSMCPEGSQTCATSAEKLNVPMVQTTVSIDGNHQPMRQFAQTQVNSTRNAFAAKQVSRQTEHPLNYPQLPMATVSLRNSAQNLPGTLFGPPQHKQMYNQHKRTRVISITKPTTAGSLRYDGLVGQQHQIGGVLYSQTLFQAMQKQHEQRFLGNQSANYKTMNILSKTQNEFTGIMDGIMTVQEVCSNTGSFFQKRNSSMLAPDQTSSNQADQIEEVKLL